MDPGIMSEVIRRAAQNAREGHGGPFAAAVVRGGVIVSRATNRVTATCDPTAHAEVLAIREACAALGTFQLDGCDLYASCEPCPMCLGAIYWARPSHVYYAATRADAALAGFDDEMIYAELAVPPEARIIPFVHADVPDARDPFSAWLATPLRVEY